MSSFHDQIFSEIDAARKLAAEFANRHGRKLDGLPQAPNMADRAAQEEAAAAEISALAAEEARLASQARERAEHRARARAEEKAKAEEVKEVISSPEPAVSGWNAKAILNGLAKLRVKERSAAEDLIRKAHEVHEEGPPPQTAEPKRGVELPAVPVRGMWSPSLGTAQVWYFTSGGTRCGPVTFAELRTMAASRVLDPRLDMVWKEGLQGWKQAGQLDGLYERRSAPAETKELRGLQKLRKVAALPVDLTAALASKQMHWPGVRRRQLWLGLLIFPLLWSQVVWWSRPILIGIFGNTWMPKLLPFAGIVPVAVVIYLVLMRLVNLGMSRWWALVLAVPVVNLWVAFRCLACPSGYAHHRKMDRSGIVIALAVVVMTPAAWFISSKHPGLLSPANLQAALHRVIAEKGK